MSPGVADPLKVLVDDAAVAGWVREGLPADHDWRQHARAARDWLGITEDLIADWNHELQAVLDEV
jgi:hypothetical protein